MYLGLRLNIELNLVCVNLCGASNNFVIDGSVGSPQTITHLRNSAIFRLHSKVFLLYCCLHNGANRRNPPSLQSQKGRAFYAMNCRTTYMDSS